MSVTDRVDTAALVRETRKRLGLTQVQFAQALGVSFQSSGVRQVQRGE